MGIAISDVIIREFIVVVKLDLSSTVVDSKAGINISTIGSSCVNSVFNRVSMLCCASNFKWESALL